MITQITGDLLKQSDLDALVHQCNCFHTMGGGIARQIRAKWPEVYAIDKTTAYGDRAKLGTYSRIAVALDKAKHQVFMKQCQVYNMYSQYHYCEYPDADGVFTDYKAMEKCLQAIAADLEYSGIPKPVNLGMPFNMGCGLAGGDWKIVRGIIHDIFWESKKINITIVRYPG